MIWGGVGTNGQHAFHQLLHQGTHLIPADFIVAIDHHHQLSQHHDLLFANCLSQSQALMLGRDYAEIFADLITQQIPETMAKQSALHQVIPGNRPSNTLLLSKLTPYTLGALIALYEHKVFVQGAIWNINSFDQWGVELGKQLTTNILQTMRNNTAASTLDVSTRGLIKYYKASKP